MEMVTLEERVKNVLITTKSVQSEIKNQNIDEKKINEYLDMVNTGNKYVNRAIDALLALNNLMLEDFNTMVIESELYQELLKVKNNIAKFIATLTNSALYSGIKTTVQKLKDEYHNFTEIIEDYELSRKVIPLDEGFKELINTFEAI
jgi:DNA polymerase III alpha subunit (gram-positive type)